MAPLESCACAAKIGPSRCGSREVSERRPERGGCSTTRLRRRSRANARTSKVQAMLMRPTPMKCGIETRRRSALINWREIARTDGKEVLGRGRPGRQKATSKGNKAQEGQADERRQKRSLVQTVLRSKASGDRFPADTTTTMTLATVASRRSRIDGEAKSEEAKVSGDAHRLQERRILRGV